MDTSVSDRWVGVAKETLSKEEGGKEELPVIISLPALCQGFSDLFRLGLVSRVGDRYARYHFAVVPAGLDESEALTHFVPHVLISQVEVSAEGGLWSLGRENFPEEILIEDLRINRRLPLVANCFSEAILLAGQEILRAKGIALEQSIALRRLVEKVAPLPLVCSRKLPRKKEVRWEVFERLCLFEVVLVRARRSKRCEFEDLRRFSRRLKRHWDKPDVWLFPRV